MADADLQKLGEALRDIVLRSALIRFLLNTGGEIILFEEDLEVITNKAEPSQHQIAIAIKEDPLRIVVRLLSPERFEELKDLGAPQIR